MKLTSLLAIITILFVLGLVFMPVYGCGCSKTGPATSCLSNLKQQGLALTLYSGDENDRFPNRDFWMDSIGPYVKNPDLLREPAKPVQPFGYAFNSRLSNAKLVDGMEGVPLVYDSVNPIRNASDLVTSLPVPGRHMGKDNIAYADAHAKSIPIGRLPK